MSEHIRWGACTDVGLVRRVNEDSKCHEYPLFAVADGMGGHSAGDVASALAIETLSEQLGHAESLSDAVRAANKAIYRRAAQEPELTGMGTTLTAMVAGDSSAQIAHVGDSRAYLLREGQLSRLTQDHTVVGRLVQQGRLHQEDADRHPQRSYLERALGVDSDVEVDVHVLDFKPGDRVLLCSDGLFGMVDDDLITRVLTEYSDPQRAAELLCSEAVKAGGHDNVTSVVVDFPQQTPAPPAGQGSQTSIAGLRTDTGPLTGAATGQQAVAAPPSPPRSAGPGSPSTYPGSSGPAEPPGKDRSNSGRWRMLRYASLVLVVLVAGAFGVRMVLTDSWYVGGSDGKVGIFSGIPGNVAGFSLSELEEETDLELSSVPEPHRSRLEEGIKADSRSSAEEIVANLTELAGEPGPIPTPTPADTPTPAPEQTGPAEEPVA